MDSHTKRLTIYVPQDLSQRLAAVKENDFHGCTQTEMLRDLISRGLQVRESQPHDRT